MFVAVKPVVGLPGDDTGLLLFYCARDQGFTMNLSSRSSSMSSSVSCPFCQGLIENDPALSGQQVSCPHCNGLLIMPQVTHQAVTPPPRKRPQIESPSPSQEPKPSFDFSAAFDDLRKKQPPSWLKYCLIGFVSLIVLRACVGIIGGGATGVSGADFKDDPAAYKGQTIRIKEGFWYITTTPIREMRDAAQQTGLDHYSITLDRANPNMILSLDVPVKLDVPGIEHADRVHVTFRCSEGSLHTGNIVTSLKRQ